jgi:hypothetical protein
VATSPSHTRRLWRWCARALITIGAVVAGTAVAWLLSTSAAQAGEDGGLLPRADSVSDSVD